MNYRHAYHAGNFADVLKHAVLSLVLVHMAKKEAAYRVIDTHAGIGMYDLAGEECDTSCVYTPEIYYMFLYCENRSEWLSHVDGGVGQTEPAGTCPEILYFETSAGSGYYPSQAEFEAENPCPE